MPRTEKCAVFSDRNHGRAFEIASFYLKKKRRLIGVIIKKKKRSLIGVVIEMSNSIFDVRVADHDFYMSLLVIGRKTETCAQLDTMAEKEVGDVRSSRSSGS